MIPLNQCIVLTMYLTFIVSMESSEFSSTKPEKKNEVKSKPKAKKRAKKEKKIHVKALELDFDVPEVITAIPTVMVELMGGEFDYGSQFHFKGDKLTSPKVPMRANVVSMCQ